MNEIGSLEQGKLNLDQPELKDPKPPVEDWLRLPDSLGVQNRDIEQKKIADRRDRLSRRRKGT